MAKIKEIPGYKVIIIGLYTGPTKPNSVDEYVKDFIQDLKLVTQKGLHCNGKHYSIALPDAFICDAPAHAFLKPGTIIVNALQSMGFTWIIRLCFLI